MSDVSVRLSGTNLERAADHNQRIVLHAIRVHPSVTRVALSNITGLTAPAVANIVKRLTDEGLIVETGRLRNGRGQPGKVLEINPTARLSFGINIDRDHMTIILVNFLGEVLAERHWEHAFLLPEAIQKLWLENAPAMLLETGASQEALCGIGIAIPDGIEKLPMASPPKDYVRWSATKATELFARPFEVPIFQENDAKAAALGEQQFGSGPRYSSSLYLLISSGLGSALIENGHIIRGANGRSGEIGLIPCAPGEMVQDFVSLAGLAKALEGHGLTLLGLLNDPDDDQFKSAIADWLTVAVDKIVPPLVAANCLLNPAAVLIGSRLPDTITERLAEALESTLRSRYPDLPSHAIIRAAELEGNAPAIGAALLPFIQLYLPIENSLWKND